MQLPASSMQHIEDAAILHDIGKVAVDDRVLNKVGKLTEEDWAMIRRHPVTGADLVIRMSDLDKVSDWIRHHHERPDGKGYPDGLTADQIPVESSIISVVDAFDAMVGGPAKEDQRPYRQPMSREDAIAELRRHAGTQFHAQVVDVFVAILQREKELEETGQHVAPKPGLADDSLWASPLVSGALASTAGG
jgi:HD-GYP domain-containing protein (c-di-GMP phosphodiesterase class II)